MGKLKKFRRVQTLLNKLEPKFVDGLTFRILEFCLSVRAQRDYKIFVQLIFMKDSTYAIMRKTEVYVVISKITFIQKVLMLYSDEPNYFPELEILKLAHKDLCLIA